MYLIPAIDLRGGKVVRLIRGQFDKEIVYGENPAVFAQDYERMGAEWLHVVDLEGALRGEISNFPQLHSIRKNTRLKIEFGGGVRSMDTVHKLLSAGVDRVILGTKGLQADFVEAAVNKYPDNVAVSLDTQEGMVQTQGWTSQSKLTLAEAVAQLSRLGIRYLIYTNIAKDGMMSGPDLPGFRGVLLKAPGMQVILSGGIGEISDIRKLKGVSDSNFYGCIIGRALYEKKFTLKEALDIIKSDTKVA